MAAVVKHGVVLMLATAAALAMVAGLHALWGETIWANRKNYERRLLAETLAGVPYESLVAAAPGELPVRRAAAGITAWWRVLHQQETVAVVVRARVSGYGGAIVFVAAFDRQGNRLQSRIVRHVETPGIADFLGEADGAERAIDGVSGATITANALAAAVRDISMWIRYNRRRL